LHAREFKFNNKARFGNEIEYIEVRHRHTLAPELDVGPRLAIFPQEFDREFSAPFAGKRLGYKHSCVQPIKTGADMIVKGPCLLHAPPTASIGRNPQNFYNVTRVVRSETREIIDVNVRSSKVQKFFTTEPYDNFIEVK